MLEVWRKKDTALSLTPSADAAPSSEAVELRRRLHDLTRLVSDWVWEVDADLGFTYVSDRVFEVLGYHPRELYGRRLTEFAEIPGNGGGVAQLGRRRPFRNIPAEMVSRTGERRHFLISGLPIFCDDTGAFKGFRGTAEDTTERKIAEQALGRRDAVLEAVSRAATVLLAAADWRREMPALITLLGEASGADHVHIFEATYSAGGEGVARSQFHWRSPESLDSADPAASRDIPLRAFGFSNWEKRLRAGEVIAATADALPQGQRWFLAGEGIRLMLVVPIFAGDAWWGFVRFDKIDGSAPWAEAEIEAVKAAAGIIGGAIHRHHVEQTLRASETRFSTAFHTSPDAIAITRVEDGVVLEVNEGFTQLTGYGREDVIGKPIRELCLWDDPTVAVRLLRGLMKRGEQRDLEAGFRTRDGAVRVGSVSAKIVELNGEQCVLSVARDMTRRHQADETIRKLSQALEQSPALVVITDTDGTIEYVNPKFVETTGYTSEEVIGRTPAMLKSGQMSDDDYRAMWKSIKAGRDWWGEIRNRKKDGQHFWAAQSISPIRAPSGEITHFVAVSEDLTTRRFYEERLRHQANHDLLTDLPNRTLFFDRLPRALARARRDGWSLSLMLIDLDSFKFVNEGLGPDGGDEILRQVARRLSRFIGPTDTVARLASDEFAVVIAEGGDRYHAAALVPDILATLAEPFRVGDGEVFVHASVGIAVFPEDGEDEYSLLKNADTAMQRAKELGGNTYQFFAPGMNAKAATYISLGQDLRHALQKEEFDLYYQPVLDIRSGMVVGAEALLRWCHPKQGMIPPDRFIGLAEESGLIEPIGEWVLRRACRQNRAWRDMGLGSLRVAVNVSSRQLQRGRLVGSVFAALSDSGLSPSSLGIEITESGFLADVEENTETLRKLSTMGIAISVDDFGTGYSSLSYLRRLPLSTLKIDRAFVQDVTTNPDAAAITDVIIAMAHRLNLSVIAEGVEEEEQLQFLRDKGCEMMQGYYFSRPIPADDFTELLRTGRRLASPPDLFSCMAAKN
jgi:diguanylate cyclase (GGDEF)-like protein/PAS domain S-box-containing protein